MHVKSRVNVPLLAQFSGALSHEFTCSFSLLISFSTIIIFPIKYYGLQECFSIEQVSCSGKNTEQKTNIQVKPSSVSFVIQKSREYENDLCCSQAQPTTPQLQHD